MLEEIGISTTAVDKNIRAMCECGILEGVGSDRTGYWKILRLK